MTNDGRNASEFALGSSTRRHVMKAAGAVGLVGASGTTAGQRADSVESVESSPQVNSIEFGRSRLNLGGRLVVGENGFPTIQAAMDVAEDGDVVYVHSSYDAQSAGEEFPIVLDQSEKQVALVGGTPSGSEINAEHVPDENVIEVYGVGPRDYRNTPLIENLKIVGGNIGILVAGAPNSSFSHLKLFKTNSHGICVTTNDRENGGSFGSRWYDCEAWSCGGSGFRVENGASPHGTTFIRCNSTWNGWNGNHPGVQLRGYSSVWQSGTIQRNSSYGIEIRDGGSQVLRDTYFESNGLESDYPVQVHARGTMGLVIDACYLQGGMFSPTTHMDNVNDLDQAERAITLHSTHSTSLRDCSHRNHSDGFVAVQGSHAADNDVYEQSHHNIHGNDEFWVQDYGERTRSNGVIREQDLRDVEGTRNCDQGIHDGSGSGQWGPAVWNGDAWVSLITGQEV